MKKWACKISIISVLFFSSACSIVQNNNKENFTEGYYFLKEKRKQHVFVNMQQDTVQIHYLSSEKKLISEQTPKIYPIYAREKLPISKLYVSSFDVDFLTLILKFRPATSGMEAQINTNINGVVYLGRRVDAYTIKYTANPLKEYNRTVSHYGFSLGGFIGLGSSTIGQHTTNNQLSYEYDGVILNKGIAAIIAVDNFTIGFSLGFDNLLDKNKNVWIYQNKPNVGLAVGMNLN